MSQQQQGRIGVEISNNVATVALDNPDQHNALTKDMCLQLIGAFAGLAADPEVAAIVVTGAGSNFSAGIAIDQMNLVLFDKPSDDELVNHFDLVDRAITGCPKPTIAVVRGNCFGGAWQLAAACDIQLAADNTRLAITPAKVGLVFPRPGIERLVQTVGQSRAKYLLFSGAGITMEEASVWGLFTRVVPQEKLESELATLIFQMSANSNFSIQHTKEAIAMSAGAYPDPLLDAYWEALWQNNARSEDLQEGREAFAAKRRPEFKWRYEGTA
ncbi:enoyl-CoA hydratase/isomerase family protein [Glutamicibacter arilaitensis]|uniref:enoyl-CoA hydratase/isomerase family protein n=1 Tax=Glutamicibacter arilaitensis TaxID=256701 RepID=UPI00384E0DFD